MEGLVAEWRHIEGCRGPATTTVAGALTQTLWSGCRRGTRLGYALYAGGSHAWPAGDDETPSAERVIWAFFRRPPVPVPE